MSQKSSKIKIKVNEEEFKKLCSERKASMQELKHARGKELTIEETLRMALNFKK
jgi:hypothetical protein